MKLSLILSNRQQTKKRCLQPKTESTSNLDLVFWIFYANSLSVHWRTDTQILNGSDWSRIWYFGSTHFSPNSQCREVWNLKFSAFLEKSHFFDFPPSKTLLQRTFKGIPDSVNSVSIYLRQYYIIYGIWSENRYRYQTCRFIDSEFSSQMSIQKCSHF